MCIMVQGSADHRTRETTAQCAGHFTKKALFVKLGSRSLGLEQIH